MQSVVASSVPFQPCPSAATLGGSPCMRAGLRWRSASTGCALGEAWACAAAGVTVDMRWVAPVSPVRPAVAAQHVMVGCRSARSPASRRPKASPQHSARSATTAQVGAAQGRRTHRAGQWRGPLGGASVEAARRGLSSVEGLAVRQCRRLAHMVARSNRSHSIGAGGRKCVRAVGTRACLVAAGPISTWVIVSTLAFWIVSACAFPARSITSLCVDRYCTWTLLVQHGRGPCHPSVAALRPHHRSAAGCHQLLRRDRHDRAPAVRLAGFGGLKEGCLSVEGSHGSGRVARWWRWRWRWRRR